MDQGPDFKTNGEADAALNTDPSQDRHARILDAAGRCFVRSGFHRTTMHDVASEAGMSPGNLYRYFPSKDAIVAGLAERDRRRVIQDISDLLEADDFLVSFAALGRKHFIEDPPSHAVLCLEIWAEATRNATFANLMKEFDQDVHSRLMNLFERARERGIIAPFVNLEAVVAVITALGDSLFIRRAIDPNFDTEQVLSQVMAVIKAAFAGHIDFKNAQETNPAKELES